MKAYRILLFLFSVIALLALLSLFFPEEGIVLGKWKLFFPSPEEVMKKEKRIPAMKKIQQYQDSLMNVRSTARNDSLLFYTNFFNHHPARILFPNNNLTFLNPFFDKLTGCLKKNEIIHILHYGDSQIEGDRITGLIRQKLQEKFGGNGPGLIPLVQPIPSASVIQTASENIGRYIVSGNLTNKANHNRYGVLGQVAEVKGSGTVSIAARNWSSTFENVKRFSKIRLFISRNSPDFRVGLSVPGKEPDVRTLPEENTGLRVLSWNLKHPVKKFTLQFSGFAEITGISIDGGPGVAVDNIPLRGSSGTFFTEIDSHSVIPALKELNVQLILLEFGGNSMPGIKNEKNIMNYKQNIGKQIRHLYKIYPAAKIILIGPADMSTKVRGRLQSYPFLEETINGLKEAALENNAAFWNMYDAMGGENSMIDWVNNKPPLATSDYVHFTVQGANKIAEMFYEALMNYYNYAGFVKQ